MSTPDPQHHTSIAAFVFAAAATAASLAQVIVSPMGSSPDEDFHAGSMRCSPSVGETGCQVPTKNDERAVTVLQSLIKEHATCYVFDHSNSALCALNASDEELAPTLHWDDGNYPWDYHQFAHLLMQRSTDHAVLTLRTVNTLPAVGLTDAIIALASSGPKRTISITVTIA